MYATSMPQPPGTDFIVTETLDEIITEDGLFNMITES